MASMNTLHEIAVELASKQPGMVDALTEEAPVLDRAKWTPTSHGLTNLAEKLTEVTGPGFVKGDAPLPFMGANTEMVYTDVSFMGGNMEVPTMTAVKFGGPEKYFARRQDSILRKAGMDTELQLVHKNWLAAARAHKNLRDAGASGEGWFLLAVRFDDLSNVGLYDPDQFENGRMFKITLPYGGQEHMLHSPDYQGVLGYAVTYRAAFGWQMLDPRRTVSAIVNIDEDNIPTATQINDMLTDVRATPANTIIVAGHAARSHAISPHKEKHVQLTSADKDMQTTLEAWDGIPFAYSHNFNGKIKHINV